MDASCKYLEMFSLKIKDNEVAMCAENPSPMIGWMTVKFKPIYIRETGNGLPLINSSHHTFPPFKGGRVDSFPR